MAKYLIQASYTQAGLQGLVRDGGSKRRSVVERMIEALGGRMESFSPLGKRICTSSQTCRTTPTWQRCRWPSRLPAALPPT